ncbi:Alpha/Beta hydrolase protein [Cladorrhinum sp. PSN259]|nr:Alpha/Beta hydrolase protein [Cladorrhinum sp. PSN259]
MPTRIPTEADFSSLSSVLPHTLHFPSPAESTTSILLLFHGLGDTDSNFSGFARNLNLPGVLAITVRGVTPVPPSFLGEAEETAGPPSHFHWGDDLRLDTRTGELDTDPGYTKAERLITEELITKVLIQDCGWNERDILLLGYGQGGSLALGMGRKKEWKGVVSVGGELPLSMVSTESEGEKKKGKAKVLVLCGRESEAVDEDAEEVLREEFEDVKVVRWKRAGDGMPQSEEEVMPLMEFLGERLRAGWV